jgi:hypothetical protein
MIALLTRKTAPTLGYQDITIELDAVLEDTLEASVTLSDYPLEVGVNSNDHRFINPTTWSITGAVSNSPFKISATDFTGALTEVADDSGILATTGGLMAGWLSSSGTSRAAEQLDILIKLMTTGEPFTVFAGDITLSNMVIESIRRTKDADNENSLIFTANLREWFSIDRAVDSASGKTNVQTGTDTASSASNFLDKGEAAVKDAAANITSTVSGWFNG